MPSMVQDTLVPTTAPPADVLQNVDGGPLRRFHVLPATLRWAGVVVLVGLAYTVIARLSLAFTVEPLNVAALWPPAGLAVGALLLLDRRRWWVVLAGVAMASLGANVEGGNSVFVSLGFTAANVVEPLLAASLLTRVVGTPVRLTTLASVWRFALLGAVVAPVTAGIIGAAASSIDTGAPFFTTWLTWWVADGVGILAVAPILLCAPRVARTTTWRRRIEGAVLAILLTISCVVTFFAPTGDVLRQLPFPAFPLLAWAAIRFGASGAALAVAEVSAFAIASTAVGHGPFGGAGPETIAMLKAQAFVAIAYVTTFTVAAVIIERDARTDLLAEHEAEAERRAWQLDRVTQFARAIGGTLDVDDLAIKVATGVSDVVSADLVLVYILDEEDGRYYARATRGAPAAVGREAIPGTGLTGRALSEGHILVDPAYRIPFPATDGILETLPSTMAVAAVPLIIDDRTMGAITIGRADLEQPFDDNDRHAMATVGELCALALRNAESHSVVSRQAVRDSLTGLPNRYYFDLAFAQLSAQRARLDPSARVPVSVILFDLDHFGAVNKERGHATGDIVLRAFGTMLGQRLRKADVAARIGGEEFAVILLGTPQPDAVTVAQEIRTRFARTSMVGADGVAIKATVSAGVAQVGAGEASFDSLLPTADVALAMAKRAGRNQVIAA